MNRIAAIILLSSIYGLGLFSCKKDSHVRINMGYNYFPNQIGRYVIYDVDSIYYYNSPVQTDTVKFQLKEKIESIYWDNQNRPTIRLERYKKYYNSNTPYLSMQWVLANVWSENLTNRTAEKVEENVRFIKLAFPINKDQKWNGNAQNTNESCDYSYEYFDATKTIGNFHFDSVLQVTQVDDKLSNIIERKYYIEKYAKNVGLVYKQIIDIQSSGPYYPPKPIMQRITSGFQYSMTINCYGVE